MIEHGEDRRGGEVRQGICDYRALIIMQRLLVELGVQEHRIVTVWDRDLRWAKAIFNISRRNRKFPC